MSDDVLMVLARRYGDGSGSTTTHIGDRKALGRAFAKAVPFDSDIKRGGYSVTVAFHPAPVPAPAPTDEVL